MSRGDLRLYEPGKEVDVEVVANSDGEVAERGDVVDVVGESTGRTQVEKKNSAGPSAGTLKKTPTDFDEDETYAQGDSAGTSAVFLGGPVDWYEEADAENLSPGDGYVIINPDGELEAFVDADDDDREIVGYVWATGTRSTAATAEKVAVVRTRF